MGRGTDTKETATGICSQAGRSWEELNCPCVSEQQPPVHVCAWVCTAPPHPFPCPGKPPPQVLPCIPVQGLLQCYTVQKGGINHPCSSHSQGPV